MLRVLIQFNLGALDSLEKRCIANAETGEYT